MFHVYILKSRNKKVLYIGNTNNLAKRLQAHNSGKNISTKPYIPWVLVYAESYFSKEDAVNREQRLKQRGQAVRRLKERIKNSFRNAC
ncbi:MAG: GIY-YIG nuclease family protein [Candidatus Colwellbacteria bacterium]|nr:GIY-YIG nuclease family protein [Candidatus Colwellbacteria bacterium]